MNILANDSHLRRQQGHRIWANETFVLFFGWAKSFEEPFHSICCLPAHGTTPMLRFPYPCLAIHIIDVLVIEAQRAQNVSSSATDVYTTTLATTLEHVSSISLLTKYPAQQSRHDMHIVQTPGRIASNGIISSSVELSPSPARRTQKAAHFERPPSGWRCCCDTFCSKLCAGHS